MLKCVTVHFHYYYSLVFTTIITIIIIYILIYDHKSIYLKFSSKWKPVPKLYIQTSYTRPTSLIALCNYILNYMYSLVKRVSEILSAPTI